MNTDPGNEEHSINRDANGLVKTRGDPAPSDPALPGSPVELASLHQLSAGHQPAHQRASSHSLQARD